MCCYKWNNPEGMAVGVLFAGAISGSTGVTLAGALTLAIGIAIQNFPEGAIISMPLKSEGMSKSKAFLYGALSGIVEPIAAIITILLTNLITPILPYLLSFAAGAMIYVVVEELIPESQAGEHSNIGTIGVAIGFVIMMILDVALGWDKFALFHLSQKILIKMYKIFLFWNNKIRLEIKGG